MAIENTVATLLAGAGLTEGSTTEERLTTLTTQLTAGVITVLEFQRRFKGELALAYLNRYASASVRVSNVGRNDLQHVSTLVERQTPFINGFAADLSAGREPIPNAQRVALYADSAITAGWAGIVAAASQGAQRLRWITSDDDRECEPCREAGDGGPYTTTTLPGLPGAICAGGSNCRCSVETI